jgi:hypothetical protein
MPIIPATWEAEIWRITNRSQPRQKVQETPILINSWAGWHTTVVPVTVESIRRRFIVQAGWDKKKDPISKVNRAKKSTGMAQAPPASQTNTKS